jgi:hypothetical protein
LHSRIAHKRALKDNARLDWRKNNKRTIQRQHDCSDDLRLFLGTPGPSLVTAVHNATQAL